MAPESAKRRKQKKNAFDKQQSQWPCQVDQKIPTLNSKKNPQERTREEKEREKKKYREGEGISRHLSEIAPTKSPPPARLLGLIDLFLTSYGLKSTSRKYTAQLASREELDGWKVELGVKLPAGFPDLVKIYKDWYKQWEQRQQSNTTSNDKAISEDARGAKSTKSERLPGKATVSKAEATSSSGGSSGGSSGSSSKGSSDENSSNFGNQRKKRPQKHEEKSLHARSPTVSSWTSDSDADNEEEPAKTEAKAKLAAGKPPSASSSTSSGSESEASAPPKPFKKTKAPSRKSSPPKPAEPSTKTSTDSSVTLQPTSPTKPIKRSISDSSSSSPSTSPEPPSSSVSKTKPLKRKHPSDPSSFTPSTTVVGATNSTTLTGADRPATKIQKTIEKPSRFQRVPHDIKIDPKLASNAYRAHDYGDRAFQDLSVVRGKGFMKEKNKKKRGSYRGGTIDVSGGKGIKFE